MMRVPSSRRPAGGLTIVALAIVLAALPSSAVAMRVAGKLSPRLAELASPSLRNASPATQARAIGLSPERLARQGRRLLVTVRLRDGISAARNELEAAGARTLTASRRYRTATVAVSPTDLPALAQVSGVASVTPVFAPFTAAATCPSGAIVSEGDLQLGAETAREANPGVDGTGVRVGILSDSFDQATESGEGGPIATTAAGDVASGDLPGANACANKSSVLLLGNEDEEPHPSDEGRAMTQIVHDLAPGAKLRFATAFNGEEEFAANIHVLALSGAKIIADDVFYPTEPFFQDGLIAVAVKEVVEGGVTYFSAAGNDNLVDEEGHDIASWETPGYRDAGSCPPAVRAVAARNPSHCLDFNPGSSVDKTFGIKVEPGATLSVDLQWDEPWFGVNTDLDAYLLNATGGLVRESLEDNTGEDGNQVPLELLEWTNSSASTQTVQLVVNRFTGSAPRVKFALIENGAGVEATEYPRSSGEDVVGPTVFGHSGSASAISVGAVPFNNSDVLEPYSSRGPVLHDFGPVQGASPATPIAREVLAKPDLVATDCGKTTFFSFLFKGFWRFCGTSAAAPHAAAVAALMLNAEPAADPEDLRSALYASAVGVGVPPNELPACAVGAGLVEAVGAVEEALAQTGGPGPTCEPPASEVDPEEAAAPGDWGSETPPPAPPPSTPGGGSSPPSSGPGEVQPPVPSRPPRTFFLQRPLKVIHTVHRRALAVFRFGSNEAGGSFICRIDGGFFRPCPKRLARRFPPGWHRIEVAARNGEGVSDRSPARYRFRVRTIR